MGKEMGNNNTSGFREEENTKAEAPEKSLLEGGGDDVKPDEVPEFCQKEARLGSDDADSVNGDHHVTEMTANKEEEKNGACNPDVFQVISEKSTDRTKDDSEVQNTSMEAKTMELNLKENRLDTNEHEHERQASNRKEEEGEKGSNLNMIKLQLDDPILEEISDFEGIQHELLETEAEQSVEDSNQSPQEYKDALGLSLKHTNHWVNNDQVDSEKPTKVNQGIDTHQDMKEKDGEKGKDSNLNTILLVSDDSKSELKCFQRELPETKAEPLVEASDGSPQECDRDLGSGLKYTDEENGHLMDTEKSTNMDQGIGAENGADVEKKEDGLIEPKSCDEYIMLAARDIKTQDGGTAKDLMSNISSGSEPEDSLMILSPKGSMQVPEVEEKCTVITEEAQLKETPLGIETIVQDNIPTQICEIPNGFQGEYDRGWLDSEITAKETMVFPDCVAKNNQNEVPCKGLDGEKPNIAEQGMAISNLSVLDCKQKKGEMGEATEISTNNGHEAERRESEESVFQPVLGFQSQVHLQETSIKFQTVESTDASISTLQQETEPAIEKSKKCSSDSPHHIQTTSATFTETMLSTNLINEQNARSFPTPTFGEENQESLGRPAIEKSKKCSSDSPHHIQTTSATFTETMLSTNLINEQNARSFPTPTFGEENQESLGRPSNESNSDNSIGHLEMRKSPSFNIDIQSEGRGEDSDKIPLLYQIKTIEDLPNLQEISFPTPMEKRVVTLGRSASDKLKTSFLGFPKAKEETQMEITTLDQDKSAAATKKAVEDLSSTAPARKGKRRSKSSIFGNCICCSTAIN